jgi:hypothetical protein
LELVGLTGVPPACTLQASKGERMRRIIVSTCLCWFAACSAWEPLTLPLRFGMTRDEVELALGTPLTQISGRRGSELYLAVHPARQPGFYPVDERITLQFRNRHLTGWKFDWDRRRTWAW